MAQQQQLMQQQLLMQQIQRQKDAMSRFPSNIDAHLRPQAPPQHPRPNSNPNSAPNHPNPNSAAALTANVNPQHNAIRTPGASVIPTSSALSPLSKTPARGTGITIRENHETNMRMAAMAHVSQARVESQTHAEMMARAPIRGSALGSRGNSMDEQDFHQDDIMNGWGSSAQKEDKEPSEDFLNDDETENGDHALQSEWIGGGELDLNAR